jgi:preprotein translocase subunit SecD
MTLDDLREVLVELAGPEVRPTPAARDAIGRRVRRARTRWALAFAAVLLVFAVAVTAVVSTNGDTGPAVSVPPTSARTSADGHHVGFRPVLAQLPAAAPTTSSDQATVDAKAVVQSCDVAAVLALPSVPTTTPNDNDKDACVVLATAPGAEAARYYLGPAFTGTSVASASTDFLSGTGWALIIHFTPAGGDAWDTLAAQQFHKQVALEINGKVVSAPMIQPGDESFKSFQGTAVLTSGGPRGFTQNEVIELARVINDARSSG